MNIVSRLKRFRKAERGQGAIEYALVLALISIVAIGVLSGVGGRVKDTFSGIVGGFESSSELENVDLPENVSVTNKAKLTLNLDDKGAETINSSVNICVTDDSFVSYIYEFPTDSKPKGDEWDYKASMVDSQGRSVDFDLQTDFFDGMFYMGSELFDVTIVSVDAFPIAFSYFFDEDYIDLTDVFTSESGWVIVAREPLNSFSISEATSSLEYTIEVVGDHTPTFTYELISPPFSNGRGYNPPQREVRQPKLLSAIKVNDFYMYQFTNFDEGDVLKEETITEDEVPYKNVLTIKTLSGESYVEDVTGRHLGSINIGNYNNQMLSRYPSYIDERLLKSLLISPLAVEEISSHFGDGYGFVIISRKPIIQFDYMETSYPAA